MASSTAHVIVLSVNDAERPIYENKAHEAVTPGELVAYNSDNELIPHGTAGGNAQPIFVVEDPYNGDTANPAIDVDYSANETARIVFPQAGDVINAFLKHGVGQTVNIGDPLESDGAGALQKHTAVAVDAGGSGTYYAYTRAIVGYAAEDKDNSGGGARCRVRVRIA